MQHVGMLRTANEVDFIEELMRIHVEHFDTIYFLDDSTDGTGDIVRSFPEVVWSRTVDEMAQEMGDDGTWENREWIRQPLMEYIIKEHGEGTWITLLHGDEVLYHCPQAVAERAEFFGWTATVWNPMHFFLHTSQEEEWDTVWMDKPVGERLRFYCPGDSQEGWMGYEVKQFRATTGLQYCMFERYRYYPHGVEAATNPPPCPIYLHMGYRTPDQAMARVRHNFESGFQPVHRGLLDTGPFLDCLDGLSEVCEYTGSFGSRELPDVHTYTSCSHRRGLNAGM